MQRVFAYSTTVEYIHKNPKKLESFINDKIKDLETLNWEIADVDVVLRGKAKFVVLISAKTKETA